MKKFAVLAIGSLVFSSSIFAADLRTATNFLHAYTAALCAAKHGDQTKAVELLAPFESKDGPELQATVRAVKAGDFEDASVQASWVLVKNSWLEPRYRFAVDKAERRAAIEELRECFGATITGGPQEWQAHVDRSAAMLAVFLNREIEPVLQPRGYTPGTWRSFSE
jgi:hypothetical protein